MSKPETFCSRHRVILVPAYLPRVANLGADALSRGMETREWFLDPVVTKRMFQRLGTPEVDLFASSRSAKVRNYFTLDKRDSRALGVNALQLPWEFIRMYAFLPPQLILLILAKMRPSTASLILVTPRLGSGQHNFLN